MGLSNLEAGVIDAGPLIHLAEIGALNLLRLFNVLHIPGEVWRETIEQGRIPESSISVLNIADLNDTSSLYVTRAIVELAIAQLRARAE